MPNPNPSIQLRSGSRVQTTLNPVKGKGKHGKSTLSNNRKQKDRLNASDSNNDKDIEVIKTVDHTADGNQKRKLNNTKDQTEATKTWKVRNPSPKYKVVDGYSRNWRICKRIGDELWSRTPDRNNLSRYKNKHTTRFTFKVMIPMTDKPDEALISIFSEFFQELKKIDNKLVILP
jgi:hypothetical protein